STAFNVLQSSNAASLTCFFCLFVVCFAGSHQGTGHVALGLRGVPVIAPVPAGSSGGNGVWITTQCDPLLAGYCVAGGAEGALGRALERLCTALGSHDPELRGCGPHYRA